MVARASVTCDWIKWTSAAKRQRDQDVRYYARLVGFLRQTCRLPDSSELVELNGSGRAGEPKFACRGFGPADVTT